MGTAIFQVNAFTADGCNGNPAAVMPLDEFPEDSVLQSVARENAMPVTAFIVRNGAAWNLRWFTATNELPLCGHGTIASAWVVSNHLDPGAASLVFETNAGPLPVRRDGDRYAMDFPARYPKLVSAEDAIAFAIGATPIELHHDGFNYLAVLDCAATVRALEPDIAAINGLARTRGLIVTARGDDGYDCVSRYFTPQQGVAEDAVTGSAHCALTPFWCDRLAKTEIRAFQASPRGGELIGRFNGDRVELEGACRDASGARDAVDLDASAAR